MSLNIRLLAKDITLHSYWFYWHNVALCVILQTHILRICWNKTYHFNSTSQEVNESMYFLMFLPGIVLSTIIHNRWSLRAGLLIAALMTTLGALIKLLASVHHWFLFIGQSLWGLANPSIVFASATVAVKWFEDSKRVLALSIIVSLSYTAFINGFGFTTLLIDVIDQISENNRIRILIIYSVKALFWAIVTIIFYCTFRSKPEHYPSESSCVYRDDDIVGTYRQLYLNSQFMLLTFSNTFYYIMLCCIYYNFFHIWSIYGIEHSKAYNLRFIISVLGLFGSIALGVFLHYTKMYKTANIMTGVLSILSLVLLLILFPSHYIGLCFICAFYGFVKYQIVTIWYIYSIEIAYPLRETTVLGFINAHSTLAGHGIGFLSKYLMNKSTSKKSVYIFISLMWLCAAIGIILAWLMKPVSYQRIHRGDIGKRFVILILHRNWIIY